MEVAVLEVDELFAFAHAAGDGNRRRAIVRVDEIHVRPRQELRVGIAEDAPPGGIDAFEVAVHPGDAHHVERQREEPIELLLRATPIDEHADLIAHGGEHRQQARVRFPDFAAEELHHAEHFAAKQDREAEGRVQSLARRDRRPREVAVARDVGNPRRLTAGPDAAGKTDAGRKRQCTARRVEFGEPRRRGGPDFDAAEDRGRMVHGPERAVLPLEGLANRLEDLRRRFVKGSGRKQGPRSDVLRRETAVAGTRIHLRSRVGGHG